MSGPDSLLRATRDLRVIDYLGSRAADGVGDRLLTQAVAAGNDPLMPGGLAMVALAGVANLESYGNRLDTAEQAALARAYREGRDPRKAIADVFVADDDEWEPPLQTLCFWSESWRTERDMVLDRRPTVATEAAFLRNSLDWAWDNEPHWDDFVRDMSRARARLEAVLTEGVRPSMRGVPCLYDECRGARLIRTTVAKSRETEDGEVVKTWVLTDWHCPRCERTWDEDSYAAMVTAELHRAKTVYIDDEVWVTVDQAAKRVGRSKATIWTWVHRGELVQLCVVAGRRTGFVRLADVIERDAAAGRRRSRGSHDVA